MVERFEVLNSSSAKIKRNSMSCIQNFVDTVDNHPRITKCILVNIQVISIVLTTIAFMSCQCIFFNGLSGTAVRALACTGLAGILLHFILTNVFTAIRADVCEPKNKDINDAEEGQAYPEGFVHDQPGERKS